MRMIVGFFAVCLALATVVVLGAQFSLDRSFAYSKAAARLPILSPGHSEGLVRIPARGMSFRARVAGLANKGPGLILLHGFPETSWMWKPLLAKASAAGFRVVAFDQRGYSPGARPLEVTAYAMPELLSDVLAIADAVGFERFHLIGHDWGSIVGWNLTGHHPDRVLSWSSLSIAHPGAIESAAGRKGPPSYVKVFRMKGLMENVFGWGNRLFMRSLLYRPIAASDLDEYLRLFAEPGGLTAGFNWYRAKDFSDQISQVGTVSTPTLWIYGSRDMKAFSGPRVRKLMPEFVIGPYEVRELDAGHWLIQEKAEAVVATLMEHLQTHRNDVQGAARLSGSSSVPKSQS